MAAAQPDELYYFSTVTFRAGNSLFQVPRLYFEKNSSVFCGMFSLPPADNQEGTSDSNPIDLQSIGKVDFQRLMTVMFPDLSRFTSKPALTGREEWTSVLKLSTLWRFGELRQEAIDELSAIVLDPVDKVTLARAYSVEHWLVEAYTELVKREAGISPEEQQKLGSDATIQLYREREDTFKLAMHSQYYGASRRALNNVEQKIRRSFRDELANIKCDGAAEETTSGNIPRPSKKKKKNQTPEFYWQTGSLDSL